MESESSVWLVTKASLTLAGSPAWRHYPGANEQRERASDRVAAGAARPQRLAAGFELLLQRVEA